MDFFLNPQIKKFALTLKILLTLCRSAEQESLMLCFLFPILATQLTSDTVLDYILIMCYGFISLVKLLVDHPDSGETFRCLSFVQSSRKRACLILSLFCLYLTAFWPQGVRWPPGTKFPASITSNTPVTQFLCSERSHRWFEVKCWQSQLFGRQIDGYLQQVEVKSQCFICLSLN